MIDGLRSVIPTPQTELQFTNEYELIVAVLLSAQCTDDRINKVTPLLFDAFNSFQQLSEAEPEDVFPYIRSVTYPNNKSKHLVRMARQVCEEFGGKLPRTTSDLTQLAGVGRKTAQVVSSVAFDDQEALPVDTHVFRVANRVGLVENADTPLKVEKDLKSVLARGSWGEAHHLLILHGRYTCTARSPKCATCAIAQHCRFYEQVSKLPAPIEGLDPSQGKYFCKTRGHYFDRRYSKRDRRGVRQVACPQCGSMNVYRSKTGRTTRVVRDYRVNKTLS